MITSTTHHVTLTADDVHPMGHALGAVSLAYTPVSTNPGYCVVFQDRAAALKAVRELIRVCGVHQAEVYQCLPVEQAKALNSAIEHIQEATQGADDNALESLRLALKALAEGFSSLVPMNVAPKEK